MSRRANRADIEDRWHRTARKDEQVFYPADAVPEYGVWCLDSKHGTPGTLVRTARHGAGMRWQARWVADGTERSKSFAKKAEAQAHVAKVTTEIGTGTYVDRLKSSVTFAVVAEEWYTAKSAKCKASTMSGYRTVLDANLIPKWGEYRLSDISHSEIQEWVVWMTTSKDARQPKSNSSETNAKRQPLSARTAVKAEQQLKQILDYAIRTKRLALNPTAGLELPRVVNKRDRALTVAEVTALVEAAGDVGPVLLCYAYTGCRFGELAAARVGSVDLKRRRIVIDKAVTEVRGEMIEDTPKTHQTRVIPILTVGLVETLTAVMAGRGDDEYLFPEPNGKPMRNWWLRHRLDKAREAAGLTDITPKTLRHTAGSLALGVGGASIVATQRLLGHKDPTTTMRVYSHMLPDDFDNLTAAMDKATAK